MLHSVILSMLGIVAAGVALGLSCNALRERDQIEIGRPYFAPASAAHRDQGAGLPARIDTAAALDLAARAAREFAVIDAARALDLLAASETTPGRVLFIDSRQDALFLSGHVPGALQIDYFDIRRHIEPALPFLRVVPWLIVYCESADCEDGFLLCQVLRDEYDIPGDRLQLYLGGMQQWRELRHPIARGAGLR